MRSSIRTRLSALVLSLSIVGVLGITGTPAQAGTSTSTVVPQTVVRQTVVPPGGMDGSFSCSYPSGGYTFDQVISTFNSCGVFGTVIKYRWKWPVDDATVCFAPRGWAITRVRFEQNSCALAGSQTRAIQVNITTPVRDLWSCNIPEGWISIMQSQTYNTCGTGYTTWFKLAPR